MKFFLKFLLVCLALLLCNEQVKASHISGADITYRCIGSNQYIVTLNLFRDCQGIPIADSTGFVRLRNTCDGSDTTLYLTLQNPGGTELSQICNDQMIDSYCYSEFGFLPGMQLYTYSDTITIGSSCDSWEFDWWLCCRNSSNNLNNVYGPKNYDGPPPLYVRSLLNISDAPCSNSPVFSSRPIPYRCINQPVSFNYGVLSRNKDSNLKYKLVNGLTYNMFNYKVEKLSYQTGYSGSKPIPGIIIDSLTGQVNFTPTAIGKYVVVVEVEEYDLNGILIGIVGRDMEFVIQNCSNLVPNPPSITGKITKLTGTAIKTGDYSLQICPGDSFSFQAIYTDSDTLADGSPKDSLSITSNFANAFPGAKITSSGKNPLTITYSWKAPITDSIPGNIISVNVHDDACPIYGETFFAYNISLVGKTSAGPDIFICGTDSAHLSARGGDTLVWSIFSGDKAAVLSCDTCAKPVVKPSVTTTFIVTGLCNNKDTVIVIVADPIIAISAPDTSICKGSGITLNVTGGGIGATYKWQPTTGLSNSTIQTPIASPTVTTTYTVTGTDAKGCKNKDSIIINVLPLPDSVFTAVPSSACIGRNSAITYTGNAGSSATYVWSFDGGIANPGSGKGPQQVYWSTTGTKKITLSVTENNCSGSSSKSVTVSAIPPAPTVTAPPSVCQGNVAGSFTANAGTGGSLNWYSDSQLQTLVNTGSSFASNTTSNTTYWVTETKDGCTSSASPVNLVFYDLPGVSFRADPETGNMPLKVTFTNTSSADVTDDFSWDLENGVTANIANPSHTYNTAGTFIVTLTGRNANCEDTATATIIVNPFSSLFIPNVFTPNGDNVNDEFKVQAFGMKEFRIIIYNRWGKEVYRLDDPNQGWNGLDCEDGTYYYVVKALGKDGVVYDDMPIATGFISLISKKK